MRILIVEDDDDHARALRVCFEAVKEPHYTIEHTKTLKESVERLIKSKDAAFLLENNKSADSNLVIEAVLLDLSLPDAQGKNVITKIREVSQHVGIVAYTGWGDRNFEKIAKNAGADALLHKGVATLEDIFRELQFVVLQKKHEQQEHKLEETLRRIGKIVDRIGNEL